MRKRKYLSDWDILRFIAASCMDLCSERKRKGARQLYIYKENGGTRGCTGITN